MLVEAIRYTGDAGFEHERVRLGESIARNALVVFDTHQILATFDAFSMSVVTMFDMLLDLLRTRIPGLDGLDGTDGKQLTSRLRSLRDTYPEAGRVLSLLQSHKHWIDDIVDLRHRAVHGPISPRVNGFLVLAAKGQPVPLSAEQVTPPTVRQLNGMIVPLADYARAACDGLHELAAEFRDIAYPPLERAARVES